MTGIAFFALALLAALAVGSGRRFALSNGWRRGSDRSPAAALRPARAPFPARAGRAAGPAGPCGGSSGSVAKAA